MSEAAPPAAQRRARLLLWLLLPLAGCQAPVLDATVPGGFNLSGIWLLDPAASDPAPEQRRLRSRGIGIAFVAHDFPVLTTRRMVIEQNADSMGIRYDRGVYRDVSWGQRQRGLWEVNAGFEEGVLRILSKARDGKVAESMTLERGGRLLVVRVQAESGDERLDVVRVFEREAP